MFTMMVPFFFSALIVPPATIAMTAAAAAAAASLVLLVAAATVLTCKLIHDAIITTPRNAVNFYQEIHDREDGWQAVVEGRNLMASLSTSSVDVPAKVSAAVHDDEPSVEEESSPNGSRVVVPKVHFELANNQVHEVLPIQDYSQEEKQSCWYTRQEFVRMQTKAARIQKLIRRAKKTARSVHFELPQNQVHEILPIQDYSQEEKESCWYTRQEVVRMQTKATRIQEKIRRAKTAPSKFARPAFVDNKDPLKNDDLEEEDEATVSIAENSKARSTAPTDDDMDDLVNALSKLSLNDKVDASKTGGGHDFESSVAELPLPSFESKIWVSRPYQFSIQKIFIPAEYQEIASSSFAGEMPLFLPFANHSKILDPSTFLPGRLDSQGSCCDWMLHYCKVHITTLCVSALTCSLPHYCTWRIDVRAQKQSPRYAYALRIDWMLHYGSVHITWVLTFSFSLPHYCTWRIDVRAQKQSSRFAYAFRIDWMLHYSSAHITLGPHFSISLPHYCMWVHRCEGPETIAKIRSKWNVLESVVVLLFEGLFWGWQVRLFFMGMQSMI